MEWFHIHFLSLVRRSIDILIDFMIFLSPFLDVIKMSMSAVSFIARTVRLWNSLSAERFPLTYDPNSFEPRVKRHLLLLGSF